MRILKALQPVKAISGGMPGTAPHPRTRMSDYDDDWTERLRASAKLIKGRFMRGNVAYVSRNDLALYAAAFRRPTRAAGSLSAQRILEGLERHGPMLKSTLRELTGLERGRFNQSLTALNRSFEAMEIQRTLDWDSPWDLYRRSYPEADVDAWRQVDARSEVLRRFTRAFGPATITEMADWSGWQPRIIQKLLDDLLQDNKLAEIRIDERDELTYLAQEDTGDLREVEPASPFLAWLPSSDPLVSPQWSYLVDVYRVERLPYCLGAVVEDGEIIGAAWGHYKRRFAHIEELNVEPEIVHVPPYIDQVLAALEEHVRGGHVPICIYGINGPADAPWVDEILTRNGYVRTAGYYVKD
jgi:ATP-dependent Lhr-like helicase